MSPSPRADAYGVGYGGARIMREWERVIREWERDASRPPLETVAAAVLERPALVRSIPSWCSSGRSPAHAVELYLMALQSERARPR